MALGKTTKTYLSIKPLAKLLLEGKVLCIDPSTGSQSSMPGFAYYEKGQLIESGIIKVNDRLNRSLKLFEISRTIREDFPIPDILVVEYIPPVSYKGGMNSVAVMALQKAIGAIMAAHPFEHLLEIPASAWKSYKPDNYEKTDEWDAVALGNCAISVATEILTIDMPVKKRKARPVKRDENGYRIVKPTKKRKLKRGSRKK